MAAFAAGDDEAFVRLYRKYRDRMVSFSRRLLGDVAQAEEAAQDVFLKLYDARQRYQPTSRFSTFLYRIATNHCLNLRARHDHRLTDRGVIAEEHAQVAASQSEAVADGELRAALTAALTRLPERQRAALVLCHHEGLSYQEAATAVGVSVSAIKSLVHRARESMSEMMRPFLEATEVDHAV